MRGACRCGQVNYQVKSQPLYSGYCHCHACQKRNSAPCVSLFLIQKSQIDISGNTATYHGKGGSGKDLIEHRCDSCGDALYSDITVLDNVIVCLASTLDDPADFKPEGHLWVSSRDPRFDINDDLEQQAGPPMQMMPYLAK
ncbi:GFA family protein [uncultured Pseudoteredinibacter sp.]|uniref:GFA family protein n=1 Tax=uncultured Pseudoteredinibacter sp. TaxID=1641701 RepID=UPI00260C06EB|nr:GFA family protein [uncultured Pseudoteredinibacter sp.]